MAAHDPSLLAFLAAAAAQAQKQGALQRLWWLWLGLVLLCLVLIRVVAALGKRRQHAAGLDPKRRKRRAIKDAWEEAGKRAEPLAPEDMPDQEDER